MHNEDDRRADPRLAPSQWETSLKSNQLGANLDSALRSCDAEPPLQIFDTDPVSCDGLWVSIYTITPNNVCWCPLIVFDYSRSGLTFFKGPSICGFKYRLVTFTSLVAFPHIQQDDFIYATIHILLLNMTDMISTGFGEEIMRPLEVLWFNRNKINCDTAYCLEYTACLNNVNHIQQRKFPIKHIVA